MSPAAGLEGEATWAAFVEQYSKLLLRVAFAFAPGYDGPWTGMPSCWTSSGGTTAGGCGNSRLTDGGSSPLGWWSWPGGCAWITIGAGTVGPAKRRLPQHPPVQGEVEGR